MSATRRIALFCSFVLLFSSTTVRATLQSPAEFFGHPIGEDRSLLSWEQIVAYMEHAAAESDRAELLELGPSTEGRPFVMMVLSDEDGVANARDYRHRVAELYDVANTDAERADEIAARGKAILAFSLGVHSTEVGAPQASVEIVHDILSGEDATARMIRKNLIVLVVPCMNPDGLEIVREWYDETVGTDAEGSGPLELYHPYAGHDNNRDGFFNNLVETSYWSRVLYHDWLPQMIVDEHQMGSTGPRLFLPPFDDPISPSVHPLVYSQLAAAGQQVVSDLTALGHQGIATHTIFTAEWPGSVRSTGFWHNMLGILSEVASARLATPLYFPPGSLQARGRGLSDYERRTNFLEPWPGGWWRLRDIIDLERDLTQGFLRWAAQHRSDLLRHFWQMNRDAVVAGRTEGPRAFVIPRESQHDPGAARRMVEILRAGGVEVDYQNGPLEFGDYRVEGGAWVVSTAQPFRPFVLEMLGDTNYPMVTDAAGAVIRPYDVTAWSLPLLLGAKVLRVEREDAVEGLSIVEDGDPGELPALPRTGRLRLSASDLRSYADANRALAAEVRVERVVDPASSERGDFLLDAGALERAGVRIESEAWSVDPDLRGIRVHPPRVSIFSPFGGSMDEGWTRLILERAGFSPKRARPGAPELASEEDGRRLRQHTDVFVLPSISSKTLSEGRQTAGQPRLHEALWPEEYRRGLGGPEAGAALRTFAEEGGTVVVFDDAVSWAVDNMGLPIRVGLQDLDRDEFYAPGTLVRCELSDTSPLNWGMPGETAAYFASGITLEPMAWPQPTEVAASYARRDVRMAGFLQGAPYLEGEPALVRIPVGAGNVVLFGFSPQRRAQTEATFRMFFNALYLSSTE